MYFHVLLFNSHLSLPLKMSVFLSASLASKTLLLLLILIVTIVPPTFNNILPDYNLNTPLS